MTSKDYWEKRALQRETEAYDDAADAILRLRRLYDDSARRLSDSAKLIFNAYLKASGIDEQQARQLLSIQETAELLDQLRKEYADTGSAAALAKLNAPAYAYRINRVQALRKAVEAETTALAEREQRIGELRLVQTYDAGYYKTMYDAAASENGAGNFSVLPQGAVDEAIQTRWKGSNYSERVWKDREITATEAGKIIESGVAAGKSVYSMSRELADLLNSASYVAERLIRTETNRIHNDAARDAYASMGVEEYQYLATLDARTCIVCGVLDGKHFKVADAKTGVNFPPMHPNDRCTTVAHYPDEPEGTRVARDPETGRNYKIPGGVTYEQWRREITEKYGADALEKARQRITYKKSDAAQLAGLKKVLGKDAPEDIAAFQNLKYNEPEKWRYTKLDYSRRKELIKHPEFKLPNAEKAIAADAKFEKYLFGGDHPAGLAKGRAFTSRLGYDASNWRELRGEILKRASEYPTVLKGSDAFGNKYEQKIVIYGLKGSPANVIIGWNVLENNTKLATAYIKEVKP